MASTTHEVLDPAATVEKLKKFVSGVEMNRRHFMAALGVAGVAAGTGLVSGPVAHAQQPSQNGYSQVDVLNFLLNIKYLKGTFYSYITQGADLPGISYVTLGLGQVYNIPAKITTFSSQQADLFNEMYYDDLNQLIDLRNLIESASPQTGPAAATLVGPRQTMCIQGTASTTATATYTVAQAIAQARMMEDLSVSAFAGALSYLTGANLAYAAQAMAVDGFHASALRLISIQTGTTFLRTEPTNTFQIGTIAGMNTVTAISTLPAVVVVGSAILGTGIPAGATITSITSKPSATFAGIVTKSSNIITNASTTAVALVGQPITGTNIPALTVITQIGTTAGGELTHDLAGCHRDQHSRTHRNHSPQQSHHQYGVERQRSIGREPITGTNVPAGALVSAASGTTITMNANATASSMAPASTGTLTSGSASITAVTSISGMISGQVISGTGIVAGTTILALIGSAAPYTVTISQAATASGTKVALSTPATVTLTIPTTETITIGQSILLISANATATASSTASVVYVDPYDNAPADPGVIAATVASGSTTVTVTSVAGLAVNQVVLGTGIPAGTTIASINSTGFNHYSLGSANCFVRLSLNPSPRRSWSSDQPNAHPNCESKFLQHRRHRQRQHQPAGLRLRPDLLTGSWRPLCQSRNCHLPGRLFPGRVQRQHRRRLTYGDRITPRSRSIQPNRDCKAHIPAAGCGPFHCLNSRSAAHGRCSLRTPCRTRAVPPRGPHLAASATLFQSTTGLSGL